MLFQQTEFDLVRSRAGDGAALALRAALTPNPLSLDT